ncbi:MAG: Uma2 family endonuclease [Chthoniobacteraceae bacterium]
MTEILEIPEVRQRVSPLSVEEYHRLGEFNENGRRTELIRGIVIEKMSKSPKHSSLSTRLYQKVLALLPDGYLARKEEPLTFRDSEPEPDISVFVGEAKEFETCHPRTADLVVEVAVSSAALDRVNAALYAEAGVKEYWIILGVGQTVEVYREPLDARYREMRIYRVGDEIVCASVPGISIPVAEIFG